jgi:asparagine synthase (glutamine-hydrolysing)
MPQRNDPEAELAVDRLSTEFDDAVQKLVAGANPAVVLFSGGIDSLLIAEAARKFATVRLGTIGVPGTPEVDAARGAAAYLALPWELHEVSSHRVEQLWATLPDGSLPSKQPARSVATALGLAITLSQGRLLLCGQGADELFLGYAHFVGLGEREAAHRAELDWARLESEDWPWARRLAERTGRTLSSPFLAPGVVRAARSIPVREHLPLHGNKPVLRELARRRGISAEFSRGPKRAIQYGSGVHRFVRLLDRSSARSSG